MMKKEDLFMKYIDFLQWPRIKWFAGINQQDAEGGPPRKTERITIMCFPGQQALQNRGMQNLEDRNGENQR